MAHCSGTSTVEFAMVAPAFTALLLAIGQTSLVFFAQQNLETVAQRVSRQLMTGNVQKAKLTQSQFNALVCSKMPSFMDCSNMMTDVRVVNSFSTATTGMPSITYDSSGKITNSWTYQTGNPGDILVVRVMYIWKTASAPLGFDLSNLTGQRRLLMATSVFKTEFYS
jgi:Flp pilus assembly protein TadG